MRRWLVVSPSLSDVALYYKMAKLILSFKSVVEEFKTGKACLAVMLPESIDQTIRKTIQGLRTGGKWKAKSAVSSAQEALKLKEVMEHTQTNRQGFDE